MGQKITKLKAVGGFAAETGGAISLFIASGFGIPVSTTHTITGAIVGVGSAHNARAVHWGVAGNIVIAWILTIPASATTQLRGGWGRRFFNPDLDSTICRGYACVALLSGKGEACLVPRWGFRDIAPTSCS